MVSGPHSESVIATADGRRVELKVHQCVWSGAYLGNSLAAVLDCYRAPVARAEIDIAMLRDQDFLVVHDLDLALATDGIGLVGQTDRRQAGRLHLAHDGVVSTERPPLLTEVIAAIAAEPYPTLLELDLKDREPWPWRRVEELVAMLQPVKDRVTFGGDTDWNLRRLQAVDPTVRLGFTIPEYEEWQPKAEQLTERVEAILGLVPSARDIHVRLGAAQRMREDGLQDLAGMVHARGALLDVWTLNAGTPGWCERLATALDLRADVITTETPRALVEAVAAR
jgi:glycerophosphoryl diester phosphodiesterase